MKRTSDTKKIKRKIQNKNLDTMRTVCIKVVNGRTKIYQTYKTVRLQNNNKQRTKKQKHQQKQRQKCTKNKEHETVVVS